MTLIHFLHSGGLWPLPSREIYLHILQDSFFKLQFSSFRNLTSLCNLCLRDIVLNVVKFDFRLNSACRLRWYSRWRKMFKEAIFDTFEVAAGAFSRDVALSRLDRRSLFCRGQIALFRLVKDN